MAHIKTYLRIKPTARQFEDYDTTTDTLYLRVPDLVRDYNGCMSIRPRGGVANHEFHFSHVFSDKTSQKEVFETSAQGILDGQYLSYHKQNVIT